ncbi:putative N-acetylmannosamine-6-phosphate 2-epimerase [Fervidobacterium changbaicum]|uniref:N-acylglucosamine-6-phosphate 2-epimerase n=1 Tax=Fervidobacterium changbaicum TaxID=310769 RepID=A0ABX5QQJ7_9BACT|nr:putative N-acetylmannosamine-6-phosphate 2-epimerase [Fervidobacterium changbaicum]
MIKFFWRIFQFCLRNCSNERVVQLEKIQRGIILSVQLEPTDPITDPCFVLSMAKIAESVGAVAIRTNGREHVKILKGKINIPIIGLVKNRAYEAYITPTFEDVKEVVSAGCDVVAIDCTRRKRPVPVEDLFSMVRTRFPHVEIIADIADEFDAERVLPLKPDYLATTLSGYTDYTKNVKLPNIELVKRLSSFSPVPVIAEGGYSNEEEITQALIAGAYAVVVGTAITRPWIMLSKLVETFRSTNGSRSEKR